MADLRAFVANFLGAGEGISKYEDNWVRDFLIIECDGFKFLIIQNKDVVTGTLSNLKGSFVASSEILVQDVRKCDVTTVLNIISRICWILSFASLSRVMCYGHEYPDGSGLSKRVSVVGVANYFRPSIDICDGKRTIEFIEKCYSQYKLLEKPRKLNVVIDYLVQAEVAAQPTELKLIIAFVVLENLKDSYIKSVNIPYKSSYFKKVPNPINGDDRYSFEDLLHLMLRQVKMKKGLKRIKNLRNEIIHSGVTRKRHSWQWAKYEALHDLLREYILRLLGYRGEYLSYSAAGRETKLL